VKLYVVNLMEIFLIISFVLSFITYVAYRYKNSINRVRREIINEGLFTVIQYLKNLNVRDYVTFEKYGIWRFSGRF
jgi:hypothetical protein